MIHKKPSLSIVIPALNEEKYLPLLLKDLSRQTFQDFEVIVVDGNSDDKTVIKAKTFTTNLNLIIKTSPKRNVSYQRNLGAKSVQSDWILFMDADNRLPPYFLQGIKYRIDLSDPDIFSTYIQTDDQDRKNKALTTMVNTYLELQKNTINAGGLESMLGFKLSIFNQLKGFNQELAWGEGGDICRRANNKHFYFEIFKDPQYIYSLRRLKKGGTLKTARSVAQLELSRILNRPLNYHKAAKLYPMQGGETFGKISSYPKSTIETIIQELSKIPKLPQKYLHTSKQKPRLSKRLKSLLMLLLEENHTDETSNPND